MWLRIPLVFYPSAPEAGDSTSAWNWRCPLLASLAVLRGKLMPGPSWTRAWKSKPWLTRLSGRICEPSMAARGVEKFIASLPDILVSHSALRAKDLVMPIPGISGRKCGASLAKWDRNTCSWKTSQGTLFSDSTQCLERLPTTGLMRAGQLYGLPAWELVIDGNECSSWPTPVKYDATPGGPNNHYNGLGKMAAHGQWPTPVKSDANDRRQSDAWKAGDLCSVVHAHSHLAPTTPMHGPPSLSSTPNLRQRLNPRFVEWLMGWPLGWTDCGCSETEWSRLKRQWRSHICGMFCKTVLDKTLPV